MFQDMNSLITLASSPFPLHRGYPCPYCAKVLTKERVLSYHIDSAHPEKVDSLGFPCPRSDCRRSFSSALNLKHHVDGHDKREKLKVFWGLV